MSLDINGKFWIFKDGSIFDCSADEHARIARAVMLDIPKEEMYQRLSLKKIFKPFTPQERIEAQSTNKCSPSVFEFLSADCGFVDPRVYAIEHYDWIRTVQNKFYAWEWNGDSINQLMSSEEFWRKQTGVNKHTWIELIEVKTGKTTGHTYEFLCDQVKG